MIIVASAIAVGAGVAALAGGYLFGARLGVGARDALRGERDALARELAPLRMLAAQAPRAGQESEKLHQELRELASRLEHQDSSRVDALREELRSLSRSVRAREHDEQELRATLEARLAALGERSARPEDLGRELRRVMAPLLERESETRGLKDMVQKAMQPLVERERIGRDLAKLEASTSQAGLAGVLDAIAQNGGFSSVVLSDEAGLPLAASSGTEDVESIAGSSSLVFTLAERAEREGRAPVVAMVVHHGDNQLVLHRIFGPKEARLMLTAVSRGRALGPDALDPALGSIERALARRGHAAAA